MHIWGELPKRIKVGAGVIGALLFSCGVCVATPSSSQIEVDQEAVRESAVAQAILSLQQTEIADIPPTATLEPPATEAITSQHFQYECLNNRQVEEARVVGITDGDTIRVELNGQVERLRYIGMDAPDDLGSGPASEANAQLVANKTVLLIVDTSERDVFDRLLRYVVVDGVFVNAELVRMGLAIAASYPPDTACDSAIAEAESQAMLAQAGLWVTTPTASSSEPTIRIIRVDKIIEFVDIENLGGAEQDLSGWVLVSERGNQRCSLAGSIQPGEILRIWAGTGSTGFSCGYTTNIWNNTELDPAVLYDQNGNQVSRFP